MTEDELKALLVQCDANDSEKYIEACTDMTPHVRTLVAEVRGLMAERDTHWANFCERSGDFKAWRDEKARAEKAEAERDNAIALAEGDRTRYDAERKAFATQAESLASQVAARDLRIKELENELRSR